MNTLVSNTAAYFPLTPIVNKAGCSLEPMLNLLLNDRSIYFYAHTHAIAPLKHKWEINMLEQIGYKDKKIWMKEREPPEIISPSLIHPKNNYLHAITFTSSINNYYWRLPTFFVFKFKFFSSFSGFPATKVLLKPLTGRRHQLRLHLSILGHTIVGDYTYSNRNDNVPYRMFLHAYRLVIPTELEHIDIQTRDPFCETYLRNKWISVQKLNKLDEEAMSKIRKGFPDVIKAS